MLSFNDMEDGKNLKTLTRFLRLGQTEKGIFIFR